MILDHTHFESLNSKPNLNLQFASVPSSHPLLLLRFVLQLLYFETSSPPKRPSWLTLLISLMTLAMPGGLMMPLLRRKWRPRRRPS